jgi:hypothetical protein
LGEEIIARLGEEGGGRRVDEPNLLSRWIAHEIANSLQAVERSRSVAARNRAVQHATDLILKLWQTRSSWPEGWPPETARAIIDQITSRPSWEGDPEPTGSPWVDRFREMFGLWQQELRLWWMLGLLETGVDSQRSAAALATEDDDAADLALIKRDVELHDEVVSWLKSHGAGSAPKAKALIEKRLREIAAARRKLNAEVSEQARPTPKRTPGKRAK